MCNQKLAVWPKQYPTKSLSVTNPLWITMIPIILPPVQSLLETPLQQEMHLNSEHYMNKHHMWTLDDALCFQPAAIINGSKAAALVDHLIRSRAELPEHGNLSALYGSKGAAYIYFCMWRLVLNENLNCVHFLVYTEQARGDSTTGLAGGVRQTSP